MIGRAEVRITGRRGVFIAEKCEVTGQWVHVTGRWRRRTGLNYAECEYGRVESRSWPARQVHSIRWSRSEVTA